MNGILPRKPRPPGLLCVDCREQLYPTGNGRGACRICGQVDSRPGWAVRTVLHHFPGAVVVSGA